jgi:hypothetical protein
MVVATPLWAFVFSKSWGWTVHTAVAAARGFGSLIFLFAARKLAKCAHLVHSNGFNSPSMVGINSETVG